MTLPIQGAPRTAYRPPVPVPVLCPEASRTMYYRNVSLTGQTPEELNNSLSDMAQSFSNWLPGGKWETDAEKQQEESNH